MLIFWHVFHQLDHSCATYVDNHSVNRCIHTSVVCIHTSVWCLQGQLYVDTLPIVHILKWILQPHATFLPPPPPSLIKTQCLLDSSKVLQIVTKVLHRRNMANKRSPFLAAVFTRYSSFTHLILYECYSKIASNSLEIPFFCQSYHPDISGKRQCCLLAKRLGHGTWSE